MTSGERDEAATPDPERVAIARARRRQEAIDSLEFEEQREAALRGRLEPAVRDADAWRADEIALERVTPEEARTLAEIGFTQGRPAADAVARLEEQIAQLEEQIADSRRRQQAFRAYVEALSD